MGIYNLFEKNLVENGELKFLIKTYGNIILEEIKLIKIRKENSSEKIISEESFNQLFSNLLDSLNILIFYSNYKNPNYKDAINKIVLTYNNIYTLSTNNIKFRNFIKSRLLNLLLRYTELLNLIEKDYSEILTNYRIGDNTKKFLEADYLLLDSYPKYLIKIENNLNLILGELVKENSIDSYVFICLGKNLPNGENPKTSNKIFMFSPNHKNSFGFYQNYLNFLNDINIFLNSLIPKDENSLISKDDFYIFFLYKKNGISKKISPPNSLESENQLKRAA